MPFDRVLRIAKFGQRCYIDKFVRGQLYMNTLAHFANIESNPARRDEYEGENFWMQPDKGTWSLMNDGVYKPISGIIGPIAWRREGILDANVFCMFALRASVAKWVIDPRNFAFGDTFAVLKDGDEFLRRVQAAVQRAGHALKCGLVEYVDRSTYHGAVGIFRKSSEFSYQSEFRLAILPGLGAPYPLEVGELSDITITGPLAELAQMMVVE